MRTILHNSRYTGAVVWGKTKKVRSPKTGKKIYRKRPESEWTRATIEEQRIVSDELWQRVEARRAIVKRIYSMPEEATGFCTPVDELRLPFLRTLEMRRVRREPHYPVGQGPEQIHSGVRLPLELESRARGLQKHRRAFDAMIWKRSSLAVAGKDSAG